MRSLLALLVCAVAAAPPPKPAYIQRLAESVTAGALRGHVSFLASDLLGGRDTPSPGLDIAAEYIAAQFRAAGLVPAGNDGYFQTTQLEVVRSTTEGFTMTVTHPDGAINVSPEQVALGMQVYEAFQVRDAPVVKLPFGETPSSDIKGKAVLTRFPSAGDPSARFASVTNFLRALRPLEPALVINADPAARARRTGPAAYTDAESRKRALRVVSVNNAELAKLFDGLAPGVAPLRVSAQAAPPASRALTSRNVVALLRGRDPKLRDTYLLLSAHYDHVGTSPSGEDKIFNGANDNASGVASLIEIARALAAQPAPRRSVLFIAWFGEERGLVGSRYYVSHPLFPLDRTVANINLEHTGRTDDSEGSQKGKAALTGFDFSGVGAILRKAAALTGYEIYNRKGNETYFDRSDNAPLAEAGVPAHTLVVAVEYPDYHQPGDHWEKLDYANMERFTEAVGAGALAIANSVAVPRWSETHPAAKPYREARR
jgi:hypothetical protein